MSQKTCFKCKRDLPRSEFYAHKLNSDGLLGKCKDCTRTDMQKNRALRLEEYRQYDRDRSRTAERKIVQLEKQRKKRKSAGPYYELAHSLVAKGVKSGSIIVPDHCSRCMINCTPQAHHDDHSRPFDIMWLCPICHAQRHVEIGRVKHITILNKDTP